MLNQGKHHRQLPHQLSETHHRLSMLSVAALALVVVMLPTSGCSLLLPSQYKPQVTIDDHPMPPPTDPASTVDVDMVATCQGMAGADTVVTDLVTVNHPTWGPIRVVSCGPVVGGDPTQQVGLFAVDRAGNMVWSTGAINEMSYKFELADPAVDASGNIFVMYNPGRYDGVMILRPTPKDIQVLAGTFSQYNDAPLNFYFASLSGPGIDGLYQIEQYANDCVPDCASGTESSQTYVWNGKTYVMKK